MLNSVNDTIPDSKDYWDLFQTTGWNKEYNFSIHELESATKTVGMCALYMIRIN